AILKGNKPTNLLAIIGTRNLDHAVFTAADPETVVRSESRNKVPGRFLFRSDFAVCSCVVKSGISSSAIYFYLVAVRQKLHGVDRELRVKVNLFSADVIP